MGERVAIIAVNFTGNIEDADRKLNELRENAARGITVPFRVDGGGGQPKTASEAATFGNTGGLPVGNIAGAQLDAANIARTTGAVPSPITGSVASNITAGGTQTANDIIGQRSTARAASGMSVPMPSPSPTMGGSTIMDAAMMRASAANGGTSYALPASMDPHWMGRAMGITRSTNTADWVGAVQAGTLEPHPGTSLGSGAAPMTALDRMANRAAASNVAAVANAGGADAGAYANQANRDIAALSGRMSDGPLPALESQKSRAILQSMKDDSRVQLATRNMSPEDVAYLGRRASGLMSDNPLLTASQATNAAVGDMRRDDAEFAGRNRAMDRVERSHDSASFSQFKDEETAAERALRGGGTRIGSINSRVENIQSALNANRGTPDEAAYREELFQAQSDQAIARGEAMPIDGGPVDAAVRRQNLRGLGRFAIGGAALMVGAGFAKGLSDVYSAGNNPSGSMATLGYRQQAEQDRAARGIATSIPFIGETAGLAVDFWDSFINASVGNGFQTSATMNDREMTIAGYRSAHARGNIGSLYDVKRSKTFSKRARIGIDAEEELRVANFDIDQDASLTDEDRAQYKLDAKNRVERATAVKLRDFGVEIATGYAGAENDRALGAAAVRRDDVGVLYQQTYGKVNAMSSTTDPEERKLAEYQAKVQYDAGFRMIQRNNAEGSNADEHETWAMEYTGDRRFSDAAFQRNEAGRAAETAQVGLTGNADVDNASGATKRLATINARYDANNAARLRGVAFDSDEGSKMSLAAAAAEKLSSDGQNFAANDVMLEAKRTKELDALDKSDAKYNQNVDTVNRDIDTQKASATGQFLLSSNRSVIQMAGGNNANRYRMQGESGLAATEENNTQYAASMVGFDLSAPEAKARYDAIYGQFQNGQRAATNAGQRMKVSAQTAYASTAATLSDRPLDAQIMSIAGNFAESVVGMKTDSNDYKRLHGLAEGNIAVARQGYANQTKMIDVDQHFSAEALDRQSAYDPVGAQAFGIAGAGVGAANQLAFGGRTAEAEESRRQTIQQLSNLKKDYANSFRGESMDLGFMAVGGPRDSQNPSEVFSQIAKASTEVASAKLGSDPGAGGPIGDALKTMIGAITKGATLDDIVAQLVKLTPEQ